MSCITQAWTMKASSSRFTMAAGAWPLRQAVSRTRGPAAAPFPEVKTMTRPAKDEPLSSVAGDVKIPRAGSMNPWNETRSLVTRAGPEALPGTISLTLKLLTASMSGPSLNGDVDAASLIPEEHVAPEGAPHGEGLLPGVGGH